MWTIILAALMPLIEAFISWLATLPANAAATMDPVQKALIAKAFKRHDEVRSQAIRIGLPFTSPEVQQCPASPKVDLKP